MKTFFLCLRFIILPNFGLNYFFGSNTLFIALYILITFIFYIYRPLEYPHLILMSQISLSIICIAIFVLLHFPKSHSSVQNCQHFISGQFHSCIKLVQGSTESVKCWGRNDKGLKWIGMSRFLRIGSTLSLLQKRDWSIDSFLDHKNIVYFALIV